MASFAKTRMQQREPSMYNSDTSSIHAQTRPERVALLTGPARHSPTLGVVFSLSDFMGPFMQRTGQHPECGSVWCSSLVPMHRLHRPYASSGSSRGNLCRPWQMRSNAGLLATLLFGSKYVFGTQLPSDEDAPFHELGSFRHQCARTVLSNPVIANESYTCDTAPHRRAYMLRLVHVRASHIRCQGFICQRPATQQSNLVEHLNPGSHYRCLPSSWGDAVWQAAGTFFGRDKDLSDTSGWSVAR